MVKDKSPNVAILLFPWASKAPYIFVSDIIEILEPITDNIYLITGNSERIKNKGIKIRDIKIGVHYVKTKNPLWFSYLLWIFKFFVIQISFALNLIKILRNFDVLICFSHPFNFLFIIIAKITRKKVLISVIGSPSISYKKSHNKTFINKLLFHIFNILEKMNFIFSEIILVESESLIKVQNIESYSYKVIPNGARYIKSDFFKIKNELNNRNYAVGYIGRLEDEKGVMNYFKAISLILEQKDDIKFFIGGDGSLYDEIEREIKKNNLSQNLELKQWIPHLMIPDYLNELKLYILPSYSEGLPTAVLEAMACGTLVLSTSVGGVPDIIKDGKTGFVLKNNSPSIIAETILNVLEQDNLEEIINNAHEVIENEFNYDAAVKRWNEVFKLLN